MQRKHAPVFVGLPEVHALPSHFQILDVLFGKFFSFLYSPRDVDEQYDHRVKGRFLAYDGPVSNRRETIRGEKRDKILTKRWKNAKVCGRPLARSEKRCAMRAQDLAAFKQMTIEASANGLGDLALRMEMNRRWMNICVWKNVHARQADCSKKRLSARSGSHFTAQVVIDVNITITVKATST